MSWLYLLLYTSALPDLLHFIGTTVGLLLFMVAFVLQTYSMPRQRVNVVGAHAG